MPIKGSRLVRRSPAPDITPTEWLTKAMSGTLTPQERALRISALVNKAMEESDARAEMLATKQRDGTLTTGDLLQAIDKPLRDLQVQTAALLTIREGLIRKSKGGA